jgi:transitional endoplasmic reticulum ATPase
VTDQHDNDHVHHDVHGLDHDHPHSHDHPHDHEHLGEAARATVARPLPNRRLAPLEVGISTDLADLTGFEEGDAVLVRGMSARPVPAVIRYVAGEPGEGRVIRLGSVLWSQLSVRPGDSVSVSAVGNDVVQRVELTPAFQLFHRLGERVIDGMRVARTPIAAGATIFVETYGGGGGVTLRVANCDNAAGRVDATTEITFGKPDPAVGRRRETLADVGGLGSEIARVRELLELPLVAPGLYRGLGIRPAKGVLLTGPPGVGKTLLCRAVAAELNAEVFAVSAADLVGGFSGETEANLRTVFNNASHHAPAMIVIDELDAIAVRRDAMASQGDVRVATQLLSLMDGLAQVDGVVVLATSNRPDSIDDAFRRPGRLDVEIEVGVPDDVGRREILRVHTREMPLTAAADQSIEAAADATAGCTGADLMHLVREIGLAAARRVSAQSVHADWTEGLDVDITVDSDDVAEGLRRVLPSSLRGVLHEVPAGLDWEELAGLDTEKAALEAAARDAFSADGMREGVLLCGPPGGGKSALTAAFAQRMNLPLLSIDGPSVFNQWLGESEAALRLIFERAMRVAPSILLIDQLDSIAGIRVRDSQEHAPIRVLAALQAALDRCRGSRVLVVGITNREDLVDPAVIRPGRIGRRIEIGEPSRQRRLQIIGSVAAGSPRLDGAAAEDPADRLAGRQPATSPTPSRTSPAS